MSEKENSRGLRIPFPQVETVRRSQPGKTSPGDCATVRLSPGIIRLLETPLPDTDISLGEAYHAPLTVPFGVAGAAAVAAMAPTPEGVSWAASEVEIRWDSPAGIDDVLIGDAEVISYDPGSAYLEISVRTGAGRHIMTGNLRHRAIQPDGKPLGPASPLTFPRYKETPLEKLPGHSLLTWIEAPAATSLGDPVPLWIGLANPECHEISVKVDLQLPAGAGLSAAGGAQGSASDVSVVLPANSSQILKLLLRADRPDEVNLGRPWLVEVVASAGGVQETTHVEISVHDARPRRVFYVLNEDCETFDGGPRTGDYGSSAVLGNSNNFMDPEDYRVQMIEKPARMNQIADRYGAKWTHFWCVPQRFAVDWASRQSATGAWHSLATALDDSIRRGSERHEYAPHIHFDYEPDSRHPPQPRLVYDPATDGILPGQYFDPVTNPRHHYHDWDGSGRGISYIKHLGDYDDSDSKAGSLHKCVVFLARLTANRRYPLVARTGGFDFGVAAEDQEISTSAYEMNGLRGNSDALFTNTQPPRRRQIYWCDARDRMREVERPEQARLAQFAVTLATDFCDVDAVNRRFAESMEQLPDEGVHVIATMAHAMFMRGEPDPFRSLDGGSFAGLDQHLAWVRDNYPDVEFATATEALVEYLDYYTPALEAFVAPVMRGGQPEAGVYEFGVRLLGRGIRVDERHPAQVRIAVPPLFQPGEVESLRVTAGGDVLATANSFEPGRQPLVVVTLSGCPEDLRLEIRVRPEVVASLAALFSTSDSSARYADRPEAVRPPLFEIDAPRQNRYSTGLLRLLMNPVAGGNEPLGRRIHPLGSFSIGVALTAAMEMDGNSRQPVKLRLRWRKAVPLSDPAVRTSCSKTGEDEFHVRIMDCAGELCSEALVELRPRA